MQIVIEVTFVLAQLTEARWRAHVLTWLSAIINLNFTSKHHFNLNQNKLYICNIRILKCCQKKYGRVVQDFILLCEIIVRIVRQALTIVTYEWISNFIVILYSFRLKSFCLMHRWACQWNYIGCYQLYQHISWLVQCDSIRCHSIV